MNALQIIGSLLAVLALIAAVRLMGLGEAELADPADARDHAEAMIHGFCACDAVVCGAGNGAIVAGTDGDFVVLKRLGSQYAARRLLPPIATEIRDGTLLHIECGDRWFGRVNLRFTDRATLDAWRARIEAAA